MQLTRSYNEKQLPTLEKEFTEDDVVTIADIAKYYENSPEPESTLPRIATWQHEFTCQDESSLDAATEPYKDTSLSPILPLVPTTKTEDVDSDEEFCKTYGIPYQKRPRTQSPVPCTVCPDWKICGLDKDPDMSSDNTSDAAHDMVTNSPVDPFELSHPCDSDDFDAPRDESSDKSDVDSTGTLEYDLPSPGTPVEQPNENP